MKFYMPTRVYDEPDCVRTHGKELAALGKKALIVTGHSSSKKNGSLQDVTDALTEQGTPYVIFDEVEENPSVETVLEGADLALSEGADFVIGIGGGSPMDASKAIAFLARLGSYTAASLYDPSLPAKALPVAAVPTTCGTGSEVTGVSVLTVHSMRTKASIPQRIFPVLALVDGKYLESSPQSVIVSTSVDALAHMVESYESKKADDYSKAMVLAGLGVWGSIKDVLSGEREASEEDYRSLMRASTFAGMAIAQTGTSIPHALSYILTYEQRVPHGIACGFFLAAYLGRAKAEDQEALLKAMGFENLGDLAAFLKKVMPPVSPNPDVLERAVQSVLAAPARMQGSRFEVDEAILRRIVGDSL